MTDILPWRCEWNLAQKLCPTPTPLVAVGCMELGQCIDCRVITSNPSLRVIVCCFVISSERNRKSPYRVLKLIESNMAKAQWDFSYAYMSDTSYAAVCTHPSYIAQKYGVRVSMDQHARPRRRTDETTIKEPITQRL